MDPNRLIDSLARAQNQLQPRRFSASWLTSLLLLSVAGYYCFASLFMLGVNWIYGNWQVYPNFYALDLFLVGLGGLLVFGGYVVVMGLWRIFGGWRFRASKQHNQSKEQTTAAFLRILATPDDVMLPQVAYHPKHIDPPAQRQPIAPLTELNLAPEGIIAWQLLMFPLLGICFLLPSLASPIIEAANSNDPGAPSLSGGIEALPTSLVIAAICGFVFFLALLLLYTIVNKRRRLHADAQGLWWWRLGRWVHMPWSAIRTIGICVDADNISSVAARYLIASDTQLIIWQVSWNTTRFPWEHSQQDYSATEQLLGMTMTSTGLPLRDLLPLALAASQKLNLAYPTALNVTTAACLPLPEATLFDLFNSRMHTIVSPRTQRRWTFAAIIAFSLVILIFGPFALVAYTQETLMPKYFASLPQKLASKSTLRHDTFLTTAADWPQQAAHDNGDVIGYTSSGYTIANGGGSGMAVLDPVYRDIALQVTVQIMGKPSDAETHAGAGIIVRYQRSDHLFSSGACTMLITLDGTWSDTCGVHLSSNNGMSRYIRQGIGAKNTLLVVARGQFTAFYVNGHFVGYDYGNEQKPFGQIGLINQTKGLSATFTDFRVWAINPPPDPNFV